MQTRVDAASFDRNAECIWGERKNFFVFGKNMDKICFKKDMC